MLINALAHTLTLNVRHQCLLQPEDQWSVDLESLEGQIDENTAAVIVNSPSNPCGSVFTREGVLAIIDICARHKLPIIADEVYEHVVS